MKLMRCTMPHWQGNTLVPLGAIYPDGDPRVIPAFFETYIDAVPEAVTAVSTSKSSVK
jgi:hypothetical protein